MIDIALCLTSGEKVLATVPFRAKIDPGSVAAIEEIHGIDASKEMKDMLLTELQRELPDVVRQLPSESLLTDK